MKSLWVIVVPVIRGLEQFFINFNQFDPEVGNEKKQQQSHRQEDASKEEPARELPQELRQDTDGCHLRGPLALRAVLGM